MIRFIGYRLLLAVPTIILVTFMVFALMALSPTDPAVALAGDNPTPERLAQLHRLLGLDKPFLVRYADWGWQVLQGNFGVSPVTHQSVISDLMFRLPITLSMLLLAIVFALVFSVVFGTLAALYRGGIV